MGSCEGGGFGDGVVGGFKMWLAGLGRCEAGLGRGGLSMVSAFMWSCRWDKVQKVL